jgi:hypothetical protein
MMRNALNWTPKRTKPAASEIAKVETVVPDLPCAVPAAPLKMLPKLELLDDVDPFIVASFCDPDWLECHSVSLNWIVNRPKPSEVMNETRKIT